MEYESSDEEDALVIHPQILSDKRALSGIKCSANNNNDVGLTKIHFDDKTSENALVHDNTKQYENGAKELLEPYDNDEITEDSDCFKSSNNIEALSDADAVLGQSRECDENLLPKYVPEKNYENGMNNNDLEKNFHNGIKMFRKNNTFPLCTMDELSTPMSSGSTESIKHGKRLLPPLKKVATKKHRTLSDTFLIVGNDAQKQTLGMIEGSPVKAVREPPSDEGVKFQVGEDELSDQEVYDTSTSSGQEEVASSSSSDEELERDQEEIDKMNASNISENLQSKLLRVLNLKELSSRSPTLSVHSAPIYSIRKSSSVSDDEDSKSVVSDSRVISSRSNSGKKQHLDSRRLSTPEQLLVHKDYMAKARQDDVILPNSTLGSEILDDGDEISESLSTKSTGILPAISSDGVRDRNFLVGNLTKHGSLLGADELNRYFPDRTLRLFVGTWNMQRKGVPRNLNDFLLPKHEDFLQDMYVIGVQEATQDLKKWEIKLQETLGMTHVLAHSVSHGVLQMSVFVRRDLIWFCSQFEDDRLATRMVSQIKTKGAVAIAFQFFGTSMIFINSHFHSGETRVKERVEDYNRIKEKIKLPKRLKWDSYKGSPNDVTTRFDCTFWFGDLNFRISQPHQIMHHEVNNPDKYDFKEVLKGDQLSATKKRGQIFTGFSEPKIKFFPTYKFTPGTARYDTSPKWRVPSYTDRILFKSKENSHITCSRYDSVTTLKKSDHRPVYGFFEVCLKPGRDSIPLGGGKFRTDVYEKAARLRAEQGNLRNSSGVCNIL